ncbi:MAG: cytochrome c3 family protein [Verrucomicrobiota bacterium]
MECASCHATHDNTYTKFMRVSNAGSAMCLRCHIK